MGPVFVALPMDVMDATTAEPATPTRIPVTRVTPSASDVTSVAKLLAAAERPLIVYGDGVAFSGGQRELVEVAEALGADVWGADASEVSIPGSHPLNRGLLGHMFGSHSTPIVQAADAVLIVGTYLLPEVFPNLESIFAPGASVIHVDLDAYEIAKNHRVDLGLVADPALTLAALASALHGTMSAEQVAAATARRDEAKARRQREDDAARTADAAGWDGTPMRPARFMSELGKRVGSRALIFDEALTSSPDLTRYISPDEPGSYYQTRGGSLGVGIPGALGAKLAHPDRTVIGFTGDGGSMYTIQALWTAAHHGIGAKFVICNNGSYKLLKLNIQQYWRERDMPEHDFPESFDLMKPDIRFDALAKSMGVGAVRVERPEEIGPALDAMLADDSPFLIDLVLTDEVAGHGHVRCGQ
jgi:benzoylformate decarboxylase